MNQKIYITCITGGKFDYIKKMVEVCFPYIDGFLMTIHEPDKATYDYVKLYQKEGRVIYAPFCKDHSLSANLYLKCGHLKQDDYFFILDSTDLPTAWFLKNLREFVNYWNKNGVGLVVADRPWIVKYNDYLSFQNPVHWGITGYQGKVLNLSQVSDWNKENWLINQRNKMQSCILNPAKYSFVYPLSNHYALVYGQFGTEVYQKHESARIGFREYCRRELKIELTLEALGKWLKDNVDNYPVLVEEHIEGETWLKDIFRINVLNATFEDLAENRFNWSYKIWKDKGLVKQDKDNGYLGVFNKYNMAIGKKIE